MSSSLVEFKTNAWKHPDMVAWYDARMRDESGINRLKNRVEVELCAALAKPHEILDVGIGTGRASLPLAARGYSVTGVDSSRAMLDHCRRLAGTLPVHLEEGDVTRLPFAERRFDTVMGLDVVIHFPDTEAILREWQRVTRPRGRIFFNVLSKDHYCRTQCLDESRADAELNRIDAEHYYHHLSGREIVELADRLALRIARVIPYGSLFWDTNYWWRESLQERFSWKRLLSHLHHDEKLLDFAVFLELQVAGELPLYAAPRLMVVFDNQPDAEGNRHWWARQQAVGNTSEAKTSRINLTALRAWSAHFDETWRERLNAHLKPLRNRVFFHRLLRALYAVLPGLELDGWLDDEPLGQLRRWSSEERLDGAMLRLCQSWPDGLKVDDVLAFAGLSLSPSFEYEMMRRLVPLARAKWKALDL